MHKKKVQIYAHFHLLFFCDYWVKKNVPCDDVKN